MRLRLALAGAAAALALGLLGAAPASAAVGSGFYGINAYWLFSTPQTEWPAQLQSMVDGGLTTVRTDARWSTAEPTAPTAGEHTYDWSTFDTIVGNLAKYGLRWMPTLDYPPPWAQENPSDLGSEVNESNVPDFVAYASALVHRYGIGGTFWAAHPELPVTPVREWEIWNSPNVTYYWDPQDNAPERYTDLYVATRAAIKQANAKAIVIGPALDLVNPPIASDEIDFVKRMFEHDPDIASKVDVWGLHPYQETIYWTFRRLAMWRQALDLLAGRRVPIAIDELGYTTTKVTDDMRGEELTELTQQLPRSGCDIYDFLPYTWVSPEDDTTLVPGPTDDPERWFGIWNRNGTPKPSGQQFVDAVLQMRGLSSTPAPTDQLNLCDSQFPVPPDPQKPVAPKSLTLSTDPVPAPPDAPQLTPPKLRGPGLRLSVTRDRRHRLLKISVNCATPCKLNGYLMTRGRGKSKYRTQSTTRTRGFKQGRQLLRLRLPAHVGKLRRQGELVVVATDRGGISSRVSRKVLIH
ncbi:MAG TPA: hypothetical protein VH817_09685 [Thermoleophilaceae bacterium]